MINYSFTDTQKAIKELVREIAQKKIKPVRSKYDETGEMPWEIVEELKQANLFGLYIPETYGGMGGGVFDLVLATEEMSKVCAGITLSMAASALGTMPILLAGTEEQRQKYLPPIAVGEKMAAFALTESEAGSDATAIKTTAVKEGNHYIVNGSKHFISSGEVAGIYTVAVSTNPARGARGISLLIIEKGTPGFSFGKKEDKMGIRANPTYELVFDNVKVPAENLLGGEGRGLLILQQTLDFSRPGVAAQALGIAQGALDETVPYLRARKQFGQPVSSFQAIQHILADLSARIEAGRALVYSLCKSMDNEYLTACKNAVDNKSVFLTEFKKVQETRYTKESSIAKVFCSDMAMFVADQCINLCGGIGYMKDFPVEKYARDAKITQIYEGTNHILRNEIAASLIKEYAGSEE